MRRTGGRHEMKHLISHTDMLQLRAKLRPIAKEDSHAKDGGYRVRSLYFDNYNDKARREKVEGIDDREKFRLRFYDNDLSFIRLGKKSKRGGICFKESIPITQEQCFLARRKLWGGFTAWSRKHLLVSASEDITRDAFRE